MERHARSWRPIISSSAILSLALLGDALIYAVLPVHAEAFGLTLPWVGVMLSANRFIRVAAYGLVARLTLAIGVRRICMLAATVATLTTALYGLGHGPAFILGARLLYGLSFAALLLATFVYAVEYRDEVGVRVGVSRAIQRLGPIVALLSGTWMVGWLGPNAVFVVLAVPTALSIAVAFTLPDLQPAPSQHDQTKSIARPNTIDLVFFLLGYGIDGLFAISITLILAGETSLSAALVGGGLLLAMRHVGEAVAAPLFGWIADRLGAYRVFVGAAAMTVLGFSLIAFGVTVAGALLMLVFRGALASLGPALIVQETAADQHPLGRLAQMQAWRDLGAAFGPLVTGFALGFVSAEVQHGIYAAVLAGMFLTWLLIRKRRRP
jgi:DHA1 family inner membrane transport protein